MELIRLRDLPAPARAALREWAASPGDRTADLPLFGGESCPRRYAVSTEAHRRPPTSWQQRHGYGGSIYHSWRYSIRSAVAYALDHPDSRVPGDCLHWAVCARYGERPAGVGDLEAAIATAREEERRRVHDARAKLRAPTPLENLTARVCSAPPGSRERADAIRERLAHIVAERLRQETGPETAAAHLPRLYWLVRNQEVRRRIVSLVGWGRVVAAAPTQLVIVHKCDGMELLRPRGPRTRTTCWWLRVSCPSTGTHYVLAVPPGMRSCEDARRWTMGLDPADVIRQEA